MVGRTSLTVRLSMLLGMRRSGGRRDTGISPRVNTRPTDLARLTRVRIRPKEFVKKPSYPEDSDEGDSVMGKMPPTDESESDA